MKKLNKIAIAVSLLGCSASASLHAQTAEYYNPSWYVAPSINAFDPDSRFGVDKRGDGYGLRFGKPISQSWDLQMGASNSNADDAGVKYRQVLLGVDGLYMFSRERLRPFLLIGAGAERDKVEGGGGSATRTSPYISTGLGFQYSITDQWSTQVDWRRVHGRLRGDTFGFDRSHNNYLTIGLNYAFNKPSPPVEQSTSQAQIPAPIAVAPAPAPVPTARFEKYTLSATELFGFDSAELRMPQPKLDEIATALNNNTSVNDVVIAGYADHLGSDKYNQALSERRAVAVKNYLTNKGVSPNRLSAEGRGSSNPVVTCTEKKRTALIKCLEPNRRVEVEEITIERRVR
jgi:OOP family OmpA-OmpF porin